MRHRGIGKMSGIFMLIVLSTVAVSAAGSGVTPLRSGEVFEVVSAGIWSWVGARDSEGDEFWIMASDGVVGTGARIEVLKGAWHERLRVDALDRVFEDCYEGRLIRVNGQDVSAYGAHGLPEGCIDLGGVPGQDL